MPELTTRSVELEGVTPIMFDRYPGDNDTKLPPEQKFYFLNGDASLCLPAINIYSFLGAQNTRSVAKMFGGKGYKNLAAALCGFVAISPMRIPLTAKGKAVEFNGFDGKQFEIFVGVPRLVNGIPNPNDRPVLNPPWELSFELTIFPNEFFKEARLRELVELGGQALGLGTYRGVYGKFGVADWK